MFLDLKNLEEFVAMKKLYKLTLFLFKLKLLTSKRLNLKKMRSSGTVPGTSSFKTEHILAYLSKDFFPISTQLNNPPSFYLPRARFARPHKNFTLLLQ